ncbi:MAG TPA: hypothetical protein VJK29_06095 [Terriglobales bacterium]|nr:hypothetical protein [Terriglobales bacterium]
MRDLIGETALELKPYGDFRCSSDRKIILGTTVADHGVLMGGLPPDRRIARLKGRGREVKYDVSPGGRYIAYFDYGKLCVEQFGSASTCVADVEAFDRISVSDSGEVFFTSHTNGTCYYRDTWHVSKKPLPGYSQADECHAVFSWRLGEKAPVMLEFLGRNPQWLTPEAASALHAWRPPREDPKNDNNTR